MNLIVPEGVELAGGVSPADWVVERLWPWRSGQIQVGSVMPEGFDAYVRIQHEPGPLEDAEGSLPREQLIGLRAALEPFTNTPDQSWFCVWAGYGMLTGGTLLVAEPRGRIGRWWAHRRARREADRRAAREAELLAAVPQVRAENRQYFLFRGPLGTAELEFDGWYQSPNLWWPDDRAWCVATEIDLSWTYVGGSRECIDRIMATPQLKAREVVLQDPLVDRPLGRV